MRAVQVQRSSARCSGPYAQEHIRVHASSSARRRRRHWRRRTCRGIFGMISHLSCRVRRPRCVRMATALHRSRVSEIMERCMRLPVPAMATASIGEDMSLAARRIGAAVAVDVEWRSLISAFAMAVRPAVVACMGKVSSSGRASDSSRWPGSADRGRRAARAAHRQGRRTPPSADAQRSHSRAKAAKCGSSAAVDKASAQPASRDQIDLRTCIARPSLRFHDSSTAPRRIGERCREGRRSESNRPSIDDSRICSIAPVRHPTQQAAKASLN